MRRWQWLFGRSGALLPLFTQSTHMWLPPFSGSHIAASTVMNYTACSVCGILSLRQESSPWPGLCVTVLCVLLQGWCVHADWSIWTGLHHTLRGRRLPHTPKGASTLRGRERDVVCNTLLYCLHSLHRWPSGGSFNPLLGNLFGNLFLCFTTS